VAAFGVASRLTTQGEHPTDRYRSGL